MKIQQKLFLAFLLGSMVLVGTMYALMQWSFDRGMMDYVNQRELNEQTELATTLASMYEENGSWDFLRDNHRLWRQLMNGDSSNSVQERRRPPRPEFRDSRFRPPPHDRRHPPPPRRDQERFSPPPNGSRKPPKRVILIDEYKQAMFGKYDPNHGTPLLPITVQNTPVGWLTVPPKKNMSDAFDVGFVREQQTAFIVISGILLVLSACIAYPLAIVFTRPIKKLAKGTHELASGNFAVEIDYQSGDELGQLTKDFNALAQTLSANETARKRWIADISHELRTPLAITRGELEAMIDGVRPVSTENIESTHHEILHLQRIVDDLYELANADIGALSYHKESLDLTELLEEQIEKQTHRAKLLNLRVEATLPEKEIEIWGDETRLSQLINNLMTNSIKYTDADGVIKVTLKAQKNQANILIEDSSPGVGASDIKKLFDPLYRVENSRNRKTGGSGLGLAICKKIVEGHNGTITASPSSLGGLRIDIQLPTTRQ